MPQSPHIGVVTIPEAEPATVQRAKNLAAKLNLPFVQSLNDAFTHLLIVDAAGIALQPAGRPSKVGGPVFADLLSVNAAAGPGGSLKQPIAKAIGIARARHQAQPKTLHVVDATAGLGEDTWLIAALGCTVTAVERNPIIATLLKDGLDRATKAEPEIAGRIRLVQHDAIDLLADLPDTMPPVDVVYLDPMFPAKTKAALQRKAMRLLRDIVGKDPDAELLLLAARRIAGQRIVVKRPLHAPPLADDILATHKGKSTRYDVYGPIC